MPTADESFMDIALGLAKRGLGRTAPNPSVGAVLVAPGERPEIIARGWTQPGGRPHAEAVALEAAGERARGTTLYVTLEPCSHHGQTPPCTDAVIAAGVARVVCAIEDPDARVRGEGIARLSAAGIDVTLGCRADDATWVTIGHIRRATANRPSVQLKLAVGADGLMAPGTGHPVWVTGEGARAQAHLLRARADAILVGSGTVAADDPELTCRLPGLADRSPVRIVLDTRARMSREARLLSGVERTPVWVVVSERTPHDRCDALAGSGARVLAIASDAGGRIRLDALLECLADEGMTRLLVEGGARVARSFVDRDLVDEAVFFTGAEPAGPGGLRPFVTDGLDLVTKSDHFMRGSERRLGSDRMTVYRRR